MNHITQRGTDEDVIPTRINVPTALLGTAQIRVKQHKNVSQILRCLCDSGAQVNLVSRVWANRIGLTIHQSRTAIAGLGGDVRARGIAQCKLCTKEGTELNISITLVVVDKLTTRIPAVPTDITVHEEMIESNLADDTFDTPGHIGVVLGAGVWANIAEGRIVPLNGGIIGQQTKLGWVIFGDPPIDDKKYCHVTTRITNEQLDQSLRRMWTADEVTEATRELSAEENWCEKNFSKTHYRDESGRYVTTISIRPQDNVLGESYRNAKNRFDALERRFARDPALCQLYVAFMDEYALLGHMKIAPGPVAADRPHYYIPHHPVLKKFRVVFDASAATTNGKSLNSIQLPGPKIQPDLFDIILRFRKGSVAISADIKKMFRQVRVVPEQWDLQRILWRRSPNEQLREYQLMVVTYGMTSAGYNAVKAMIQCAKDNARQFPKALPVVKESFYMDDMLVSTHSEEDGRRICDQVKNSLRVGGFELAKWVSNYPEILPEANDNVSIVSLEDPDISVLGLNWIPGSDVLAFKVNLPTRTGKLTKRIVASDGAKIFDPNGYLAPVTTTAKLYMQNLWRIGVEWDDPLAPEASTEWSKYYESLEGVNDIHLPRWIGANADMKTEFHAFCDASMKAYGAVVYARTMNKTGEATVRIVAARSKVADIQTVSVPRLELCAAKIGAELLHRIVTELHVKNPDAYYWTDSEIVLYWLHRFPCDLKVFTANRVARIQALTSIKRWGHVKSKCNPADLLSRTCSVEALKASTLWWEGPSWLKQPSKEWPAWHNTRKNTSAMECANVEIRTNRPSCVVNLLTVAGPDNHEYTLLEKFSDLAKAVRIGAYVKRFTTNTRSPDSAQACRNTKEAILKEAPRSVSVTGKSANHITRHCPAVSVDEYKQELRYWIVTAQRSSYPMEMACLKRQEPVAKKSELYAYVPYLDEFGIIRMRGRLEAASLTHDQRHPVILPSRCLLATRIMQEAHKRTLHGGVQLCLQYIRDVYWIIHNRRALRRLIGRCVRCAIQKKSMAAQLMADLPSPRITPNRPFQHCGVDLAGPFALTAFKGRGSRVALHAYAAVFICLSTKAVHLELVGDLSTRAFIAALDRMITRRVHTTCIYSDNGTNFVGAANELQAAARIWGSTEVSSELTAKGITWRFNTPMAPHHGGIWEAAVKSLKHHLRIVIDRTPLTYEELSTVLVRIEGCLNSRPLLAPSDDATDMTVITPAHLIAGEQLVRPLGPGSLHHGQGNRINWDTIAHIEGDIWKRWQDDYLVSLQRRNKWARPSPNVEVNDLVIINDKDMPPTQWKRGRVIKIHHGKDGLVRSVVIQTATSQYERPITRICVLPVKPTTDADDQPQTIPEHTQPMTS